MEKAFTLIEILVYLALAMLVFSTIFGFLFWASKLNTKIKAIQEVLKNTQRVMEILTYEIREAKSVYTPTSVFSSNFGQLSLETKKHLPVGEIFSFVDFYVCGTSFCIKEEGKEPVVLTSEKVEVKELKFTLISTTSTFPSVKINLTMDYENPKNRSELKVPVSVETTVSLRSY